MELNFTGVNYLAVVVAGLVVFFIGGVWYQALFGKVWVKLHGYSEEQFKALQEAFSPAKFFATLIVSYLVMSFALGVLVTSLDVQSAVGGAMVGLVVWAAVAAVGMTGHITGSRHIGLYGIDTAYQLVAFVVAGIMLGAWR